MCGIKVFMPHNFKICYIYNDLISQTLSKKGHFQTYFKRKLSEHDCSTTIFHYDVQNNINNNICEIFLGSIRRFIVPTDENE